MACGYMGCGTAANKITWAVAAVLIVIGAALMGIGVSRMLPCSRQRTECLRLASSPMHRDVCHDIYRKCAHPHLVLAAVGAAAVLVALGILCCMCCCSQPPGPKVRLLLLEPLHPRCRHWPQSYCLSQCCKYLVGPAKSALHNKPLLMWSQWHSGTRSDLQVSTVAANCALK